jgi:VCBS repeat-containing protein
LGNDTDPEGNPLTAVKVSDPAHGTVTLNATGSFTYTPAANYSGPDTFTYKVNDGSLDSNTATVSITITPVNDAPVANPDSYSLAEDTTLNIAAPGVLGNDTDADGQGLVVSAGTGTAHGSFTLRSDGSFTYTPAPNYNGPDSFTYQATDGIATTPPTTVTITVTSVNDAPTASNDTIGLDKNGFYGITLANRSSDVDGDPLTGTLVSGPQHGDFQFFGDQLAFTYKPNTDYTGQDSFTYKVNDGTLDSNVATVTLIIS